MRRALSSRGDRAFATAIAAAAALRIAAVVGQRAIVYVDSIDYEHIDWWGGRRPWVTPVLYELFDDHDARVFLQASIGAICWSYLALQAAAVVDDRRAKWVALLGVLGLSLTTTVTSWDTTLLSESLALSLAALLTGMLLRFWRTPTWPVGVALVAAWTLWLFARQAHVILSGLGIVALLVAALVAARRRRPGVLPLAGVLVGVAVVTLVGAWSYRQDTRIARDNLSEVIARRIFPDDADVGWLIDEGMPVPDGVETGRVASVDRLRRDPEFRRWLEDDGLGVYARFLLTRPWETVTRPFEGMVSDRAAFGDLDRPDDVLLAMPEAYGVAREVLPGPVEDVLFQPGQAGGAVVALAAVLAATLARLVAVGRDRRWTVPLVLLALQWPALVLVWHTSTVELGRLGLPSALLVRIALLVQAALLLDAWWEERADAT